MELKNLKKYHFFSGGLKPLEACYKKNIGLAIAMVKFEEFQELFIQAQYSFKMGIKDDHKVFPSDGNYDSAQNGIKSYYLKNAIQDYNACYDYILQIVYFGCDFYGKIESSEDYQNELKKCVWSYGEKNDDEKNKKEFKNRIDDLIKNQNDKFSDFLKKLRKFYGYRTNSQYPLANWTNYLKHKGSFTIDELFIKHGKVEIWNEKTGKMVFCTDYIDPKCVSFSEVKECLTLHNNKIVDYAEYLYSNLGFEDPACSEKLYTANHPQKMDTTDLKIRGTIV